jgi:hypothetical protein
MIFKVLGRTGYQSAACHDDISDRLRLDLPFMSPETSAVWPPALVLFPTGGCAPTKMPAEDVPKLVSESSDAFLWLQPVVYRDPE